MPVTRHPQRPAPGVGEADVAERREPAPEHPAQHLVGQVVAVVRVADRRPEAVRRAAARTGSGRPRCVTGSRPTGGSRPGTPGRPSRSRPTAPRSTARSARSASRPGSLPMEAPEPRQVRLAGEDERVGVDVAGRRAEHRAAAWTVLPLGPRRDRCPLHDPTRRAARPVAPGRVPAARDGRPPRRASSARGPHRRSARARRSPRHRAAGSGRRTRTPRTRDTPPRSPGPGAVRARPAARQ